ncbi:MAG TPA: trypsin-like serine protease [Acidimicrobiales bacterium]|nr:trypsin-like serine protease [Acidimicrobiales bacterium]
MRRALAAIGALVVVAMASTPAAAIIGGEFDGDAHPNVGIIFAVDADGVGWGSCTGTLVTPTVMVSAAHCFDPATWAPDVITEWLVTFDPAPVWDWDHMGELEWLRGTPHIDPRWFVPQSGRGGFSGFKSQASYDLAVLELDRPAADQHPGIQPAPIVARAALDPYATGSRNTFFTSVGYGVQREVEPPVAGGIFYDGTRNRATVALHKLHPLLLETNDNPQDARGTGGTCSGDSGGPVFLGSTIIAVHSYGQNNKQGVCKTVGGSVRLDTDSARAFLSPFVVLP